MTVQRKPAAKKAAVKPRKPKRGSVEAIIKAVETAEKAGFQFSASR